MSKMFKIADLTTNLFVRHTLNEDRVLQLAELMESGVKLDPIKITRGKEIIDGRHRVEVHKFLDLDEIACEIVDVKNRAEMISMAYQANLGGALPPTQADTDHTIEQLIEAGETIKRIAELLGLPAALVRKHVSTVKSRMARVKLQQAVDAVASGGLTVAKAAEKFGVDEDALRDKLTGGRKGKSRRGIGEITRSLTHEFRSHSQRNARMLKSLLDKYEDGDIGLKGVREVFAKIKQLQKKSAHSVADWEARLNSKGSGK
ncbi:MAG: hypothetical protein A3F35_03355 [Candidatus Woykebacteria bacterium RIFCSPHIGHO2_12_FULL_45_10]|uniref:ParB-like N-terminal domain-containing protein n=1 Tax=Candidatus Woykebacteria bacterium RIFCSPHIGHO2_12_FULL_45_10 TaxID=1802603 RepID=A0A1G1WQW6_9BACT|nr:MAG: hypothetical protein A3F35_03355 [Candidatus Woykebacteria bacterium RIFCSPHIGHO2_12_FULL_45_10]